MAQGVCCFIFSYFPLLTCFYFVSYPINYLTRGVCVGGLDPIVWNNQNKMGSRVHWHPSPFLWRRLITFTLSLASVLIIWEQLFFIQHQTSPSEKASYLTLHMVLKSSNLNIIAFSIIILKSSTFDTITSQILYQALKLLERINYEQSEIIVFTVNVSVGFVNSNRLGR